MSWGTELWDQFDNLEKHTQWGIDTLEKCIKFVKERTEIELSYAKQLRNLSKKYQPKKNSKEEEEYKYTSCKAFISTLNEMNDYAGQHEVISENMASQIIVDLARYVQELKQERKSNFHDGRKAQQHIETCWKQLESSKRRFERDCKEADRAQQYFEKMDADINVTKADVEKARQQAQIRHQMAEDSKADYSSILQKFNHEQHEYYHTHIPNIFQKIQEMEERRIVRIGESMKTYAEVDRQVIPIIGKCLDGIVKAAESIDQKNDSQLVIEAYKSGFEPPGDIEFEDYTQPMKRTVSDNSLSNSRGEGKPDLKFGGKSKGKLWPFIKKNKLSLKLGATPEDFSNLPPEQRRKKLQQKVDELSKEIQKEMDQRDAITKMKDVYLKNPQMGDPASLDHKLAEVSQNIEKLRLETQKFEAWLAEVEGRLPARSEQARRQSGLYDSQNPPTVNNCAQDRESSPDGSYTEEQSQESEVKVLATDFDDEFDDEEPLPAIGTCKALYTFEGQNEGTISVVEGETLYVIEEDKGDGWTRIRRNEDEEGYVPTSYVEVCLDKNAKGAKTYI
ncbi:formin-binding protein 1 isoform X14 [Macaca nemestrina]|uniref:formin-binding protein 1 isoform X14 n=1 Tax=Macaca nemestrina TaxID=9545 RepID=UPI00045D73DA|nr:formin-binding protein 1 isoform X16 [Chlorocebus sabaeus]XP_011709941.1 formin-binding protein 1 isoform X21 [Macaca nemestrina]XP_014972064.1 formin-binding protein 1 isoform X25 [Macaca mulatta]XP_045229860.1 formin-binding protein 1 isoform X21 [Macaca fascicularis]XP_050615913.1 formin-binding protein 1 isoform X16 [Macaca thibetana thibetana]